MIDKVTENPKKLSFQEFKNEVLTDYKTALVSRECSLMGRREVSRVENLNSSRKQG